MWKENIGISKDFNQFELQNALGKKDVVGANRIIRHFAANERKYPVPLITGSLYSYFSKLLADPLCKGQIPTGRGHPAEGSSLLCQGLPGRSQALHCRKAGEYHLPASHLRHEIQGIRRAYHPRRRAYEGAGF